MVSFQFFFLLFYVVVLQESYNTSCIFALLIKILFMAENAIIEFKNNDSVAIIVDFFKKVIDYVLIQQRSQMKEMFEEYCVNKDKEEDVYLTIKQVCERLNVTRQTINTWRKNGMLIPDIHIGRSPKYLESKIKILNNRQS